MKEKSMQDIAIMFQELKFKKKFIGGIDERDVWRKLDLIQQEYRSIYEAQETRYKTILEIYGIDLDRFSSYDFNQ